MKISDPSKIAQRIYQDDSHVQRMGSMAFYVEPIGALNAAVKVGKWCPLMVYNSSAAVAYVRFGSGSVTAPSAATNGIPVLPGSIVTLNSGNYEWAIASAATVFGYAAPLPSEDI